MYNIVLDTNELLMVDDFLPQDVWDKIFNQVQADQWFTSTIEESIGISQTALIIKIKKDTGPNIHTGIIWTFGSSI